mgnify:FL=1
MYQFCPVTTMCISGLNQMFSHTQVAIAYSCSWTLQSHGYSYLPLLLIYRLRLSKVAIKIRTDSYVRGQCMIYLSGQR